jgi:CheY-like chemotaxis protein
MKSGSTILIVDDEELHRLIIKKKLEDHGFVVLEAPDGGAGLETLRTLRVDLAIVDLEMPVMDGMEFTKWVKENNPKFPVIIITAHATNFSPKEIISTNVDAFMHKPLDLDGLIKTVERLL